MGPNLKQELKSIKIVHLALVFGASFFLVAAIYLNQTVGGFIGEKEGNTEEIGNILLIAYNLMAIASIFGGIMVFEKRLKNIESLGLSEKLKKYREAMIIRDATIEGPVFFFIVGLLLVGSGIFLIEALAGLILLLFFFPTESRIAREIKHDLEDILKL